jgi:hypothetical protein
VKVDVKIPIELDFYGPEAHVFMIQMLQQLYRDLTEDLQKEDYHLLEDREDALKRCKATKTLLRYYMVGHDFDRFIGHVKDNSPIMYTFDPDLYNES